MDKTHSRKTLAVLASLTVLGAGAAVFSMTRSEGSSADDSVNNSVSAPQLAGRRALGGAEQAEGPCSFPLGSRMAYEVQSQSNTAIDMTPLMEQVQLEGSPNLEAEIEGVDQRASRAWHVDLQALARATDGSTILAAHILAEPTSIDGAGMPSAIEQPAMEALSETFLVRMDPQCNIREFGWRAEADLQAARDQQRLLAGLSYLAPTDGEDGYGGLLFDAVGRYYASYSMGEGGKINGRVMNYREPFGQATGSMRPAFEIGESAIAVTPRAGEWFADLSNVRDVTMSVREMAIGSLHSSVVAHRVEPESWRAAVQASDESWTWGILLGKPLPSSGNEEAKTSSALAGVAVGDALAQYPAIVHEQGSSIHAVPLLVEWLQANPEGAGDLLAMLREGAFDGDQSASAGLFLALGTAGTPQATDVLLEILGEAADKPGHKISAALALSNIEAPTEAMIDAVVAVAEDGELDAVTRSSMAMSLGTFASRNAERAPELAERARGQIGEWLANPADEADVAGSLLAAGNTGHDDLAAAIDPYFEHEDPQIRQRAAKALRHMSPEEAYPRLSDGMMDENEAVRASAIETALAVSRSRGAAVPEDMVDMAIDSLDLQAPAREQKALLGLLGQAAKHGSEGADAVLQQHLADELESGVRNLDKLRELGRHTSTRWTAQ